MKRKIYLTLLSPLSFTLLLIQNSITLNSQVNIEDEAPLPEESASFIRLNKPDPIITLNQ